MPELILVDDNGAELFRGYVTESNVKVIAGFVARNMGTLRGLASFVQAYRRAFAAAHEALKPITTMGAKPTRPNPRPRRRGRA